MSFPAPLLRFPLSLTGLILVVGLLPACKTLETDAVPMSSIDQATFALIDLDQDGKVSLEEMAKHKHQEGISEFDLDNDRQISAAEWTAAKPSDPATAEHFKILDINQDGKIAEDEAVLYIGDQLSFREAFKKMDLNGDRHLHWEEYAKGKPETLNITLFSAKPPVRKTPSTPDPAPPASPAPVPRI